MGNVNGAESNAVEDLTEQLCDLYDLLNDEITDATKNRVLEWMLNLIENKNVCFPLKIFEKLISSNSFEDAGFSSNPVLANILACLQLQVTKCPSVEGQLLMNRVWSYADQVHRRSFATQVLVHFFDDSKRKYRLEACPQFMRTVQQLLGSEEEMDHQAAYFLMHKVEEVFDSSHAEVLKCTKQQWSDYITMMENMKEQPIHINLSSVLINLKGVNESSPWLKITFKRLLQSKNISVVYETVKFIVEHFSLSQLKNLILLRKFLAATNRTELYVVANNNRCNRLFKNFIENSGTQSVMDTLATVPWQWNSVPLCGWLLSILSVFHVGCYSSIFKLGPQVKGLRNAQIQNLLKNEMQKALYVARDEFSLEDYLKFVEMMYKDQSYAYQDLGILKHKIDKWVNFGNELSCFTKVRLDIIFNSKIAPDLAIAFINKLKQVPKNKHGWLRLFLLSNVFDDAAIAAFYTNEYQLHISISQYADPMKLQPLIDHLILKLKCVTYDEKLLVGKVSLELILGRIIKSSVQEIRQIKNELYSMIASIKRKQDSTMFLAFVAFLGKYPENSIALTVAECALNILPPQEVNTLSEDILGTPQDMKVYLVFGIIMSHLHRPNHKILLEIVSSSSRTDDAWIEAIYLNSVGQSPLLFMFMDYVSKRSAPIYWLRVFENELMQINRKLSEDHPNYLNNSKEHRHKFLIAEGLLLASVKFKQRNVLALKLLSKNDQLNIACMHELIIAKSLKNFNELWNHLETIFTLDRNEQLSLLSVTYIYLYSHFNQEDFEPLQKLLIILTSLALKQKFYYREFALLISYEFPLTRGSFRSGVQRLADVYSKEANIPVAPELQARLLLPKLWCAANVVSKQCHSHYCYTFGMSNLQPDDFNPDELRKVHQFRKALKAASIENQSANVPEQPKKISANRPDLIVVAALIEDLTRLNELIQTCKALRVGTLIVNDSALLRPNSEDTLKIVKIKLESLPKWVREKKLENYNIVATKNSAENVEFVNFSFANETVLILSNDHNGIPKNLMDLLDKTVELPQTNFQHAQNLLIFKYYNQHSAAK